jgi:hypothetical protein
MEALKNIQLKRVINLKEIINDSDFETKLFNLKEILLPLNHFNLIENEKKKQEIKLKIITGLKTIKTDFDISDDHLYILYSICSFEALLILCQMQLDKKIDVNEYKKFIDYLQKLKSNPINNLFYVLIKLNIKDHFKDTGHSDFFNNNPFTIYMLLYELLNLFINEPTENDYKDLIFSILNDLIQNTTDSEGKLRTDLPNFNYSTLFNNLGGESSANQPESEPQPSSPVAEATPTPPVANPVANISSVHELNALTAPPQPVPTVPAEPVNPTPTVAEPVANISPVHALNALTAPPQPVPTVPTVPSEPVNPTPPPTPLTVPAVEVDAANDICSEFETSNATTNGAAAAPTTPVAPAATTSVNVPAPVTPVKNNKENRSVEFLNPPTFFQNGPGGNVDDPHPTNNSHLEQPLQNPFN